jgi:hypothetical protein
MVLFFALGLTLFLPAVAVASETITYTYDTKGRVTKVVQTGSVNTNVTMMYMLGKANDRKSVKVTYSSHAPP